MSFENLFATPTIRMPQTAKTTFREQMEFSPRIKTPRVELSNSFRPSTVANPRKHEIISASIPIHSLLANSQRMKEMDLQYWIDSDNPSALEILDKIADESPQHRNILKKIIYELENLDEEEDYNFFSLTDTKYDEIVRLQLETADIEKQIKNMNKEIIELTATLQAEQTRQNNERKEYKSYESLMKKSTFNSNKESIKPIILKPAPSTQNLVQTQDDDNINKLMGENRYLKDQVRTIENMIEENRVFMTNYTLKSAKKIYKASKRKKDEELNNQFI
ncbi:hypothetical protein TVAG_051190 [Trichomonas vaginalis G3]|uniref:Uncharacterized protein n=1 Tax=Trichomonas vaginalis (strain ATCC PRA-98 / G3) TaxID=412133 RepID=A2EES8_TRIV3|nr:hypothetical protein TVAGG3_0982150 [Trichomonas vaginalis G3]EAY08884.1 hypothetical protein TVAG_051190 [Trichomonas vaginalis G3]KAI5489379.1 hypothetical protein TVAGG3_0982150 [Trichomonas vaginalis G3]|eukprot:XP_001321107.1 hypothetical protein [Trichomonas vaginalis G3]